MYKMAYEKIKSENFSKEGNLYKEIWAKEQQQKTEQPLNNGLNWVNNSTERNGVLYSVNGVY